MGVARQRDLRLLALGAGTTESEDSQEDFDAEALRLGVSPFRKLRTGQPLGKSEVVLDERAGTCLSARRFALDEQRPQTLRRGVNRGGQARGAAAQDEKVVLVTRRSRRQTSARCQLRPPIHRLDRRLPVSFTGHSASELLKDLRGLQHGSIVEEHSGQAAVGDSTTEITKLRERIGC